MKLDYWIKDLANSYQPLFIYASIGFVLALICMLFVKHGDARN